jgi:DNA modification methylase
MITWKIEKRNIEDLQGYNKNPRKFTDKGLKDLKKSLQNCGDANIITINADNTVLGGHARLTVMKQLGYTEVDVKVPEKQLSEKQVQEVVVRLNANTAGEWDLDKLQADFELDELQEWGLDIEFETLEEEEEIIEDEVPEEVETRVKRGDIWQLGNHRLMCGDSTSITDVEKLMNGEKADMVFTDPPYGMGLDTDYSSMKNNLEFAKEKNFTGGKKYAQGKVDDFTPEMLTTIFTCFNYVKEIFLWGADYFAELLPDKNNGSWIVWDKRANGNDDIKQDLSSDKMYGSCFELCWSKNKHKRDIARIKWAGVFGTEKEFDHKRHHPTQKPTALVQWFLDRYSKEKQSIVDLFGGSGSTLIACEQLNRKCYTMELDEHYCDVIITRWENLTGQKAVLC